MLLETLRIPTVCGSFIRISVPLSSDREVMVAPYVVKYKQCPGKGGKKSTWIVYP